MNEAEIFECYAERVLEYFVNKVRTPSDAGDLAQETFFRFFERIRRGDVRKPRAFLFGVANLVLKEYWKARGRHPDPLDPGACSVMEMGGAETTLSSQLQRQQGHRRMLDAMRLLRLDYQNVLELRYWHELKYDEIAEILDQNHKTIGVWLRRAKHDLRRILERMPQGAPQPIPVDEGASPTAGAPRSGGAPFEPISLERWLRRSGDRMRRSGAPRRRRAAAAG
ncbi:MAG: sigma-70 family RNA polymerase sigma factor [Myxococcota bacterium]